MRRMRDNTPGWRWFLTLVPTVLGITISIISKRALTGQYVPQLYLKADIVALTWIAGVILTLILVTILAVRAWVERRTTAKITATRQQATEERRRFLRRLDHEMKNPLTAIQAALANLAYANSPEAQAESLDSVKAVSYTHLTLPTTPYV